MFVQNRRDSRCVKESKKNYSAELEPIWKKGHLKMLIDLYLQGQSYSQIKDRHQLQYPEIKKLLTTNTIRCILFRTIRAALHHLENLIKTLEDARLPQLVRLRN